MDRFTYENPLGVHPDVITGVPVREVDSLGREYVIVSRHKAAIEFIASYAAPDMGPAIIEHGRIIVNRSGQEGGGCTYIPVLASATEKDVSGKIVIGNLPLHLAAKAAKIVAVEFTGDPPRGQEYTYDDMVSAGAVLRTYGVERLHYPSAVWTGNPG
jgi:hypothetical protein